MNWKQIIINLLVIVFVYCIGYFSSFFLSKILVKKKNVKENNRSK